MTILEKLEQRETMAQQVEEINKQRVQEETIERYRAVAKDPAGAVENTLTLLARNAYYTGVQKDEVKTDVQKAIGKLKETQGGLLSCVHYKERELLKSLVPCEDV